MTRWYRLEGHTPVPVDMMDGARALEDSDSRRVGYDALTPEVNVSTVFLALDHQFDPDGPALLFESMIFGGDLDGEQDHYSTWEEAEAGHARMVARARAALDKEPA